MERIKLGFALTGSFCTFDLAVKSAEELAEKYELIPIMSERSAGTDTRFGKAADFTAAIESIASKSVINSISAAEPIGPQGLLDILLIAPCTGNTLAKLAGGITDSSVTMAAKAHLRNGRPVVIAVSTNDGLIGSAPNIGTLFSRKNIYFVPYGQDDALNKPASLVADFSLIEQTIEAALAGKQLQPVLLK